MVSPQGTGNRAESDIRNGNSNPSRVACTDKAAGNFPLDVNLCSGAGGLALGLAQAGFNTFAFYEKDRVACETLLHNLRSQSPLLSGRVFEGDLLDATWMPRCPQVRLLAVGTPCQPFSRGGVRKGPQDDRNLFPTLLNAVQVLRPRAVLVENVGGLERGLHKSYLDYVVKQLRFPDSRPKADESWIEHAKRLNRYSQDKKACPTYNVAWKVCNAADFGVAQVRYRLFIVATNYELPEYVFPSPTHSKQRLLFEQLTGVYWKTRGLPVPAQPRTSALRRGAESRLSPWVTVRDQTSTLPEAEAQESPNCNNHWTILGARAYAGHTGSVLDWPSKTIKAGVHGVPGGENAVVCDDGSLRYYTLREMARIQSFPDEHYFTGARSNVIRQIGNAVPCALAAAVAEPLGRIFGVASSDDHEGHR